MYSAGRARISNAYNSVTHFSFMKGSGKDTLWLFLGVVLIFGVMATFSPNSTMGSAFLSFRKSIEGAFGGEVGYCPFINPYAMSIYSSGSLVIMGGHALCDPIDYSLSQMIRPSDYADGVCTYSDQYSIYTLNDEDSVELLERDILPGIISYWKDSESTVYQIERTDIESVKTFLADGFDEYDYPLMGVVYAGEYERVMFVKADVLFSHLTDYQLNVDEEAIDKGNTIAIQLLSEKRPMWQCFFIFGLIPFFITYYLLNDILTFAYLKTNTRKLIAIFASLLAILTGSFANLVVAVGSFVGLSLGQTFLLAIFSLAILAVFLGQLTVTAGVAQTTVNAVQKAVTGALVLTNLADATSQKKKEG